MSSRRLAVDRQLKNPWQAESRPHVKAGTGRGQVLDRARELGSAVFDEAASMRGAASVFSSIKHWQNQSRSAALRGLLRNFGFARIPVGFSRQHVGPGAFAGVTDKRVSHHGPDHRMGRHGDMHHWGPALRTNSRVIG